MSTGTLYIAGTPIGNEGDITLRVIDALRRADIVAVEEQREGLRLLATHGIQKPVILVNEHTERDATPGVIAELKAGKTCTLVSDCGMPVFADPGTYLVQQCIEAGIRVEILPGPSSLMTALAVSGIDVQRFYFYGFLSPKKPVRRSELNKLRRFPDPVVFLDAPYRLNQVLQDMSSAFGRKRNACVACNLTLPDEEIRRGSLGSLVKYFEEHQKKREFVIIVDGDTDNGKAQDR